MSRFMERRWQGSSSRGGGGGGGAVVDIRPLIAAGAEVEVLLAQNAQCGPAPSQLLLLLPEAALQQACRSRKPRRRACQPGKPLPKHGTVEVLIPSGHVQEVARRCQVRIDLANEAVQGFRQVMLTGTLLGTAAATYWMQVGIARCG
mmetsp:Transcript_41308/g.133101  ORF Transcript_41308/g.133101 Transcript_41308/m.133101 type:complete len:147 (+) Transcript_41308:359-799(+)